MATPIAHCGECGKMARPVMGSAIYPHRPDLHEGIYFLCACGAYCGSHASGRPIGRPAGLETRRARQRAHAAFDRLWKSGSMPRPSAYEWLAKELGTARSECHIGLFDRPTADRVTRLAELYWNNRDADQIEAARAYQAQGGRGAKPSGARTRFGRSKSAMSRLRAVAGNNSSRHRTRGPNGKNGPVA